MLTAPEMQIPIKTLKCGYSLPVYGMGTWEMGGGRNVADASNDDAEIAAIKAAIDSGITHIDTAERYGGGHSEEQIGEAIRSVDRSRLLIASKVQAHDQKYDDVLRACERSLTHLGTDYLDLFMLHRFPEPGISIAETMRAFDRLADEGSIRHIGVCNLTIKRFQAVQDLTSRKVVCNQLEYNLRVRESEARGIIEYCQLNDVFVVAWGPLGIGPLQRGGLLDQVAVQYGKTARQIALNWLVSQPNVVTIPKTANASHLQENLGSLGWELSASDLRRLSREFPDQQMVSARLALDYEASLAP